MILTQLSTLIQPFNFLKYLLSLVIFFASHFIFAQSSQCLRLSDAENARLESMIKAMSIEEKISQMRIFHANATQRVLNHGASAIYLKDGQLVIPAEAELRFKNGIAGMKNPGEFFEPATAAQLTNELQRKIIATSRQKIPALFVAEAYNGVDATGTTRFSRPISMASTWNPTLVKQAWDVIGREARLHGFHMMHSPVADIHRDPRFGRMSEGFGEDTHLTSAMITAAVRGAQGEQKGLRKTHIGAVVKHFVGYGQVDGGRNFASIRIGDGELADELLPPFKAGVDACALGIMPSHGDINGVASHGNRALLTDLLRGVWGFEGYVVSDAEDVARLGFFMGVAENDEAAALLGLNAGVDIDLYSDRAYIHLPKLVAENPKIQALIDEAVRRVLRVKFKLGLFDNPYIDHQRAAKETRTKKSLELALALDLEAATLLKNDKNTLPLTPGLKKTIALIGPLLEKETEAVFQKVFGEKTRFLVEPGLKLTNEQLEAPSLISANENKSGFERAITAAADADMSIVFIGDNEFTAKEAFFREGIKGDRAQLDPVGQQDELVKAVKALGKPVIVVLKLRRTLSIDTIAKEADAILALWGTGERGDEALALLLSGAVNPSGRLPVTVPRHVGQLPIHYSQKKINFKKHYLFEEDGPLYPFGYGLSYTHFDFSELTLSSDAMTPQNPATVTITVKNTGSRAGKEVVQLYINDPIATVTRPIRELKAFQKIDLKAGESRNVSFALTPEMMAHTGADGKTDPGYGEVVVSLGSSSQTLHSLSFTYKPE